MKRILFLGILFCSVMAFAQGTTQKEYNYALKGYADDLAMGKDVIAGYRVETAVPMKSTITNENTKSSSISVKRYSTLYKLVRNDNNKIAVFILEEKRPDTNYTRYFAIPNNSASVEIWNQAQQLYFKNFEINKCESAGSAGTYSWHLLRMLSEVLSN